MENKKEILLNKNHWMIEDYRERMTVHDMKLLFLQGNDHLIFNGHLRRIEFKRIAPGIYEVFKEKSDGKS